jgi:hypothetical protein
LEEEFTKGFITFSEYIFQLIFKIMTDSQKVNIVALLFIGAIIALGYIIFFGELSPDKDKTNKINNILLNSQVIIKSDTLDIIKTDWLNGYVTLKNNVRYDYKYISSRFALKETLMKIDSINSVE